MCNICAVGQREKKYSRILSKFRLLLMDCDSCLMMTQEHEKQLKRTNKEKGTISQGRDRDESQWLFNIAIQLLSLEDFSRFQWFSTWSTW